MVTSFVSSLVGFLTSHPHIAYLAVFLLALSESIPIIGVVVPGTAVIHALTWRAAGALCLRLLPPMTPICVPSGLNRIRRPGIFRNSGDSVQ